MSCIRRLWPSGAVTWTRAAAGIAETVGLGQLANDPADFLLSSVGRSISTGSRAFPAVASGLAPERCAQPEVGG